MKILIAAGGSGGHIFPAIALGRAVKKLDKSADILFVGSRRTLDKRLYEKEGARFELLSTNKLPYGLSPGMAVFFVKLLFDMARSLFIIGRHRPDIVIGFGGYVSFPVAALAAAFRVPVIAHEQNVAPGRANKALFKIADKIAISFEETRALLGRCGTKAIFTGNPIRAEILTGDRAGGLRSIGLEAGRFTILVIGGSQGARALNRTFVEALELIDAKMKTGLQVIHITGVADYEWTLGRYAGSGVGHKVHSFVDRIEEAYAASDLVVTRSGSSALFELALLGKPMILVPYPFAMSHQAENADVFRKAGAAVVLDEKELSAEIFKETLAALIRDRQKLAAMGEAGRRLSVADAADRLANLAADARKGKKD